MLGRHQLKERYAKRKAEIAMRLDDFSKVHPKGDDALLGEMAFCICAANSSAKAAWAAQQKLVQTGLLYSEDNSKISEIMLESHVRFHKKKAVFLIEARRQLFESKELAKWIDEARAGSQFALEIRNKIAKEVKGVGLKEAGHFLRNTGIANEFAILDRHILKNLKSLGVLENLPEHLTQQNYLEIEQKMLEFAKNEKIPISHLDLLFWSEETGHIFK